jgi:hypothetical protein
MNRPIILIGLQNAYSRMPNWKSPIVGVDSLSCSTYPLKDVARLKTSVLQPKVYRDLSPTNTERVL